MYSDIFIYTVTWAWPIFLVFKILNLNIFWGGGCQKNKYVLVYEDSIFWAFLIFFGFKQ